MTAWLINCWLIDDSLAANHTPTSTAPTHAYIVMLPGPCCSTVYKTHPQYRPQKTLSSYQHGSITLRSASGLQRAAARSTATAQKQLPKSLLSFPNKKAARSERTFHRQLHHTSRSRAITPLETPASLPTQKQEEVVYVEHVHCIQLFQRTHVCVCWKRKKKGGVFFCSERKIRGRTRSLRWCVCFSYGCMYVSRAATDDYCHYRIICGYFSWLPFIILWRWRL